MTSHTKRPRGPVIYVSITPEILERAKRANSRQCMIAEAIKEAYPGASSVAVDIQTCRFTAPEKGLRYVYLTPRVTQMALLDFDQGIDPKPFEFTLKLAQVLRSRQGYKKFKEDNSPGTSDPLSKPYTRFLSGGGSAGNNPVRTGGRAPPQMKMWRKFGLKGFKGFDPDVVVSTTAPESAA